MIPCVCEPSRSGVTHIRCKCWHHEESTRAALVLRLDDDGAWFWPHFRPMPPPAHADTFRLYMQGGFISADALRKDLGYGLDI